MTNPNKNNIDTSGRLPETVTEMVLRAKLAEQRHYFGKELDPAGEEAFAVANSALLHAVVVHDEALKRAN